MSDTKIDTPFLVSSKTHQSNIKHPELCWMDVPEWKLDQAVALQADFRLEYHHHEAGEYVCSWVYTIPARTLRESLLQFQSIYKTYTRTPFFRVYLEYSSGRLYTTYSKTKLLICTLAPKYNYKCVRMGAVALRNAVEQLTPLSKNLLMQLVARTAIWVPMEAVLEQNPDNFIYVRRRSGDPEKGKQVNGIIYDDNTHPNRIIKAAVKKYLGFGIAPKEYHVCHIWEGSCYDCRYHTNLKNLVLLPSSIYSLSDYDKSVLAMLKWRAAELFDGWHPENRLLPQKPAHYRRLSWLNILKYNK